MMRLTIERLRGVVLLGGGALVLALLGVLGWAHFRAHERLRDLPARLGADVQRDANGITYSQTLAGRVAFTLHAKHATQRRSGEAQLEDAGLVLYGEGNGRADRIYGKNFLWDQKAGVVTAIGEVQLDLGAAAPVTTAERIRFAGGGSAATRVGASGSATEPIHATTSGLIFVQGTGVATTVERVTFSYQGMQGESQGASYASRDGVLTLDREVKVHGVLHGRPFSVVAAHAVMNRPDGRLFLTDTEIRLAAEGSHLEQEVRASRLSLQMGAEGGVERAEGEGGVELRNAEETAKGPEAVMTFRRGSVPEDLRMGGGVEFARVAADGSGAVRGSARESESRFDRRGKLESQRLQGGVVVDSQGEGVARRRLTAERVDLVLGAGGRLQQATAAGGARLRATGEGDVEDTVGANRLVAEFGGERAELERVTGSGAAVLRRVAPGLDETSRAPEVVAQFAAAVGARTQGAGGGVEISKVRGDGGVVIDREQKRAGATEVERTHATARESTYDARTKRGVLTGEAVVSEPDRVLKADRVVVMEETGDAEAEGAVQASFVPETASSASKAKGEVELVHAVGARAVARRSDDSVTVYGVAGGRDARMWQGASQVEAPVLVLRDREGTMDAFGPGSGGGLVVKTVLAGVSGAGIGSSVRQEGDGEVGQPHAASGGAEVVRVTSGRLHFMNGTATKAAEGGRRAEFSGGVQVESREGRMRSQRAVAILHTGGGTAGTQEPGGMGMGGGVERVAAQGAVVIEQPGRTATGAELVWTAADGLYVLTGTPASPPEVTDAVNGRVTGGSIQFHSGDSSVVVTGAAPGGRSGRVRTETRLRQ